MVKKKFYETADFRKEQKKWDAILKEDGFNDIEYRYTPNGDSHFLAGTNGMYFVRKGQMRCQYDEEYYSAARKRRWELREQPRAPQDARS